MPKQIYKHPPELVTEVLMDVIVNGGVVRPVAIKHGLTESVVSAWKRKTHAAQYRELEEKYGREIEERLVTKARQNAERAGEIEAILIEKMLDTEGRDAPQALRAVTDAKTKNIDKVLSLTGRPNQITENRDIGAILEGLARMNVVKVAPEQPAIEATAEEVNE